MLDESELIKIFNFLSDEINKYQTKLSILQSYYSEIKQKIQSRQSLQQINSLINVFKQFINTDEFSSQDKQTFLKFNFNYDIAHIHTLKIYLKYFISIYEEKIKELELTKHNIKQILEPPTPAFSRLTIIDQQSKNKTVQDLD